MPASLPAETRKKLAAVIRERVLPRFAQAGSNASNPRSSKAQSAAAAALGVDQSTISRLVNNEQGGSLPLLQAVARYLNEDPATFLISDSAKPTLVPALRELHGYEEALHEAKKRITEEGRDISAEALLAAGDFRLTPPLKRVTAALLITLAVEYSRAPEEPIPKRRARKK